MIDTKNIENQRSMDEQQFLELVNDKNQHVFINVVKVADSSEWAIYGRYGVYVSESGQRTFPELIEVHKLINKWGVHKFFQETDLKDMYK